MLTAQRSRKALPSAILGTNNKTKQKITCRPPPQGPSSLMRYRFGYRLRPRLRGQLACKVRGWPHDSGVRTGPCGPGQRSAVRATELEGLGDTRKCS